MVRSQYLMGNLVPNIPQCIYLERSHLSLSIGYNEITKKNGWVPNSARSDCKSSYLPLGEHGIKKINKSKANIKHIFK